VRKPWSSEELHLVMHAFHKNVADGSVPDYNLIENLKKKYPSVLHGRPREQIREHACGMKTRKKRKQTKQKEHASVACSETC